MADLTKTIGTVVLAPQTLAAASLVASSAIDVSSILEGLLMIRVGRNQEAALTVGVTFRVEGSWSSDNIAWVPIATFQSTIAALTTGASEALTGTEAAGSTVLEVASTTGFAVGNYCSILNATPANSEWVRIQSIVTNTSITVEEGITNAQTGSTIYAGAEAFVCQIPAGLARIRVVVNNLGNATQAVLISARLNTVTEIA